MERFPEEVLLNIFQYISPRQIGKLLRVNRWFNYVLSRNSRRLKKISVFFVLDMYDSKEIKLNIYSSERTYKLEGKGCIEIHLLIGNGRIAFSTGPGVRSWKKTAEYLAWKTGKEVEKGVKIDHFQRPAFVVPVENPQEALLLVLETLATRIEIEEAKAIYSLGFPDDFRWKIWNCLASAGTKVSYVYCVGPVPLEEILYLNVNLGACRLTFNLQRCSYNDDVEICIREMTRGKDDYDINFVDELLQYLNRFTAFAAFVHYKLVSPESLYFPIKEWLMGSFDKFAVQFYASGVLGVFEWISRNFDVHLVEKEWVCFADRTICRRKDRRWLWIRRRRIPALDEMYICKYIFRDIDEDIREYSKRQFYDLTIKYLSDLA